MEYRKALITGSARGIGKAIALSLANQGFDVAFQYKSSSEEAMQACQQATAMGGNAIALQADITQVDQAEMLVETAAEQLGGLSVIVNNMGNYIEKPASAMSVDEWHHMLDANLNSTFYVTRTAVPHLKAANGGRIINFAFASAHHSLADTDQTAYRIAKSGIIIYTKSLAKELIQENITANVISPGVAENSVGLEETIPLIPAKRPAKLEDFCNVVKFFVSPEANYITGQVLEVAGGWRL